MIKSSGQTGAALAARLLAPYFGRRLLGVVDGVDWTEFVFDDGEQLGGNLLSVRVRDGRLEHAHGAVADPAEYVARNGEAA